MLEHEHSLRDELDPAWALRSLALTTREGRAALVLEDPGGEMLARRAGTPMDVGDVLAHWRGYGGRTPPAARPRPDPQGHQTRQRDDRLGDGPGVVDGLRHRFAPAARAPGARAARVHRRNARLHGAGTDRADESFDRFAQRSLRARRDALRNADRQSSVHGVRSDGMGALPYRETAGAAGRAAEGMSGLGLGNHHEAARQDRRGSLPDRGRRRARSAALPRAMGSRAPDRRIPARPNTTRQTGC